jgi:NAD(P)-dependent dehydrogenase (short-subunit alcohol dehydrogenase family)
MRGGALHDQFVLLTGGTDGIGRALLLKLLDQGATVTVVGRSNEKWETTRKLLSSKVVNRVDFLCHDLSLMSQVKALADVIIRQKAKKINALVHCAGIMLREKTLTKEGLEEVFSIQCLARYYLSNLLLAHLEAAGAGKVVSVSAGGTVKGLKFDFENLQGEKFYGGVYALRHESVANDMHILGLAKLHPGIRWYNYGPGVVNTSLLRDMGSALRCIAQIIGFCTAISPEMAAEDILNLLLASPPLSSGLYVRGATPSRPTPFRSDPNQQAKLRLKCDKIIEGALASKSCN